MQTDLLVDLTKPAPSFVSQQRFKDCLHPSDLLKPTVLMIEQLRSEITSVLDGLLPRLASGWARQRGEMFDFGPPPSLSTISKFDQQKLSSAPISNLDAERSVGSINHELNIGGARELKAASSAHVKAKGPQLAPDSGKVMDKKFIKMTKKGGEIPTIIEQWELKQKELKKKGLEDKEIANISIDKQRNADLEKLTKMDGPFTSPDAVATYMARKDVKEDEKGKRLYL